MFQTTNQYFASMSSFATSVIAISDIMFQHSPPTLIQTFNQVCQACTGPWIWVNDHRFPKTEFVANCILWVVGSYGSPKCTTSQETPSAIGQFQSVHIYLHINIYIYIYTCTYLYTFVHACVHTYVYTYAYAYICVCTYVCMYMCLYAIVCISYKYIIHICIHVYV